MAIDAGSGSSGNRIFEVGSTGERISSTPGLLDFANDFTKTPGLILSAQTSNDMDTANPRLFSANSQGASVFMQEETSHDSERNHGTEDVGYFAFFAYDNFYAMEAQSSKASSAKDRGFGKVEDSGNQFHQLRNEPVLMDQGSQLDFDRTQQLPFNFDFTTSDNNGLENKRLSLHRPPASAGNGLDTLFVLRESSSPESRTTWQIRFDAMDLDDKKTADLVDSVFGDIKETQLIVWGPFS